jgi:hypothetical protein
LRLEALGYGDKVYGVKQREYKMNLSKCKAKNKVWTKKNSKIFRFGKKQVDLSDYILCPVNFHDPLFRKGAKFFIKYFNEVGHLLFTPVLCLFSNGSKDFIKYI